MDVPRMVRKKRLHHLLSQTTNEEQDQNQTPNRTRSRWIRRPFLGNQSHKISRDLKKSDYKVGFYPLSTVNQLLNFIDPIPTKKQSGIYLLKCGYCIAQYIGQTGRSLFTRLSEHRLSFTNNTPSDSAMVRHGLEKQYAISRLQSILLHPCSKSYLMNKADETETPAAYTAENQNLLNDLDAYS